MTSDQPKPKKFHFFTGNTSGETNLSVNPLEGLPAPPPWRRFGASDKDFVLDPSQIRETTPTLREKDLAEAYQIGEQQEILDAVNAALLLRRPLMVTGPAGSGKSSLIYAVARELRLGPVLAWNITSRSTLREGLYDYDAIARLQEIQARDKQTMPGERPEAVKVADYVKLGPLGTAMIRAQWPKALLIDEIDKADLDLPNDLLNLFEEGKFTIEELRRDPASKETAMVRTWKEIYPETDLPGGQVACTIFPFILLTSNGEREFSAPFLRRCVNLQIKAPRDATALARIVRAHLKDSGIDVDQEAADFLKLRGENKLSTDQLMNAIFVLEHGGFTDEVVKDESPKDRDKKQKLLEILYKALN